MRVPLSFSNYNMQIIQLVEVTIFNSRKCVESVDKNETHLCQFSDTLTFEKYETNYLHCIIS